jgi:death-on-curing protein
MARKKIVFLEKSDVLDLHADLIKTFGGAYGVRDIGLLESALWQPQVTIEKSFAYKNLYEMAACYAHGIIKNHPFVDGNKRTGMVCMLYFLEMNGITANLSNQSLFDLAITIATTKISIELIAKMIKST